MELGYFSKMQPCTYWGSIVLFLSPLPCPPAAPPPPPRRANRLHNPRRCIECLRPEAALGGGRAGGGSGEGGGSEGGSGSGGDGSRDGDGGAAAGAEAADAD